MNNTFSSKFLNFEQALKKQQNELFILGLLGKFVYQNNIELVIEDDTYYKTHYKSREIELLESEDEKSFLCLQFLSNLNQNKTKYDLHFDFGYEKNEELLMNKKEFDQFSNKLKSKLSKDYNIPKKTIIVTYPQRGSFRVQLIFENNEFDDLDLDEFKKKFENDFSELRNLKEIHKSIIFEACKLSKNILDKRGNRTEWGKIEYRGNKPYYPPTGWIGYGLNVKDKYENNDWLGMNNSKNEWCVAYHGIGSQAKSKEIFDITRNIAKGGLKKGPRQVHKNCNDIYHNNKKVGEGIYCTPKIEVAENYAGISEVNGKKYKMAFMLRVKPNAIRGCNCQDAKDYWVVNDYEMRPYRILIKEVI
jgi:hypothetical protein